VQDGREFFFSDGFGSDPACSDEWLFGKRLVEELDFVESFLVEESLALFEGL
jgi:hypothetical protein